MLPLTEAQGRGHGSTQGEASKTQSSHPPCHCGWQVPLPPQACELAFLSASVCFFLAFFSSSRRSFCSPACSRFFCSAAFSATCGAPAKGAGRRDVAGQGGRQRGRYPFCGRWVIGDAQMSGDWRGREHHTPSHTLPLPGASRGGRTLSPAACHLQRALRLCQLLLQLPDLALSL